MRNKNTSELQDTAVKSLFIAKCWKYLDDNFHKFSEGNRIKISLELCKKDIPQQIEGEIKYTSMAVIKVETDPMELDLGEDVPKNRIAGELNDRDA